MDSRTIRRLDVVIGVYEATRDENRRVLDKAILSRNAVAEQVEAIDAEWTELLRYWNELLETGSEVPLERLVPLQTRRTWLAGEKTRLRALLVQADADVAAKRAKLTDAAREVKAVEKLRGRLADEQSAEQLRREQRTADELAARKNGEERQEREDRQEREERQGRDA